MLRQREYKIDFVFQYFLLKDREFVNKLNWFIGFGIYWVPTDWGVSFVILGKGEGCSACCRICTFNCLIKFIPNETYCVVLLVLFHLQIHTQSHPSQYHFKDTLLSISICVMDCDLQNQNILFGMCKYKTSFSPFGRLYL